MNTFLLYVMLKHPQIDVTKIKSSFKNNLLYMYKV
jgi:hypothetical protein